MKCCLNCACTEFTSAPYVVRGVMFAASECVECHCLELDEEEMNAKRSEPHPQFRAS